MAITIKMGRGEYTFTEEDVFLDNGACVQCLSIRLSRGYHSSTLKLTKKALSWLGKNCERVTIDDHYYSGQKRLEVFYYKLKEE